MNDVRPPTKKETRHLTQYVQKLNNWPSTFAEYDVALWFVAVYTAYNICEHKGKTMVAIDTNGVLHLLAWNEYGGLHTIISPSEIVQKFIKYLELRGEL
jgi:hypothetical protein